MEKAESYPSLTSPVLPRTVRRKHRRRCAARRHCSEDPLRMGTSPSKGVGEGLWAGRGLKKSFLNSRNPFFPGPSWLCVLNL